jgi:hypothetical protein
MKKLLLLVLCFTALTITVCMIDESVLSTATKILILVIEAVVFQLSVMDLSFLKKERRAALKKVIEDYPPNKFNS